MKNPKLRNLIAMMFFALLIACAKPERKQSEFVSRTARVQNNSYRYLVYVPKSYSAEKQSAVVLYLHGAGERGTAGRQIKVGLGPALEKMPERLREFLVVFPQTPASARWIGEPAEAAMVALDQTLQEFNGDKNRVYLTGISMGGYGSWHLAIQNPNRFAAVVPVCGGILPVRRAPAVAQLPATIGAANPYQTAAKAMPPIPVWIFHGEKDPVIPVRESRKMFQELKKSGADVRYTEYAGVDHNCWDRTYAEVELWEWLLKQKRAK